MEILHLSFILALLCILYTPLAQPLLLFFHFIRVHIVYKFLFLSNHRRNLQVFGESSIRKYCKDEIVHLSKDSDTSQRSSIRCMTWNVEFFFQAKTVLAEIRRVDPDVLFLQEVTTVESSDKSIDFVRICFEELGFSELVWCPHHVHHHGRWGCAILSKFPLHDPHFIPLNHIQCPGFAYPRGAIFAHAFVSDTPFVFASFHTEVCCGRSHREKQMRTVFKAVDDYVVKRPNLSDAKFIFAGDGNTCASGIFRFLPTHCCDWNRFASIGKSEADFWKDSLLPSISSSRFGNLRDESNEKTLNIDLFNIFGEYEYKFDWIISNAETKHLETQSKYQGSDHKWMLTTFKL